MGEVVKLGFWNGIQDEDILHACPHCDCAEFYLMADSRPVCANCESLVTNLKIVEVENDRGS
jgi:hypothetical protein